MVLKYTGVSLVLAAFVALTGCAATPDKTDPAAATIKPPSLDGLSLGDARIFQPDKPDLAILIKADGSITSKGIALGTLSSDGKLKTFRGDLFEVKAEGRIFRDGKPWEGVLLTSEGLKNTKTSKMLTIDGTGLIVGGNPNAGSLMTAGCQGDMKRTCLLVLLLATSATPPPDENTVYGAGNPTAPAIKSKPVEKKIEAPVLKHDRPGGW